jgi:hypothetical protein
MKVIAYHTGRLLAIERNDARETGSRNGRDENPSAGKMADARDAAATA